MSWPSGTVDCIHAWKQPTYWEHVGGNLENYYSNFVNHFVIEFAGLLMPWWRVAALDGARQEYYSAEFVTGIDLQDFHKERRKVEASLGAVFFGDFFPVYRRVVEMVQERMPKNDPLWELFSQDTFKRTRLSDAMWLAYALRNFYPTISAWHRRYKLNVKSVICLRGLQYTDYAR